MPAPRSISTGFVRKLEGSIIPSIWPKVLLCSLFALGVSLIHVWVWDIAWPLQTSIVPSLVLGLLLVFRTNTAYERFWEGRKAWGTLINSSRSLVRLMSVAIAIKDELSDRQKRDAIRLVAAFGYSLKQHLRREGLDPKMLPLLTPELVRHLPQSEHVPLDIAFELGQYYQTCHSNQQVNAYQLSDLHQLLNVFTDVIGICERILKTPVPLAYSIHLRQLLYAYCLTIPFGFVADFRLWTPIVVGLVAFTVFGIEEIGLEIENPFGRDPNDLPLDNICQSLQLYIESTLRSHVAAEGE